MAARFSPMVASMNHCLLSERQDDGRGRTGMTESRDGEKEMCVTLELKGAAEVLRESKKAKEAESSRVSGTKARWTHIKSLNAESHLSAPIFSV